MGGYFSLLATARWGQTLRCQSTRKLIFESLGSSASDRSLELASRAPWWDGEQGGRERDSLGHRRRDQVLMLKIKESRVTLGRVRGLVTVGSPRGSLGEREDKFRGSGLRWQQKALPGKGSEKELGKLVCQGSVRSSRRGAESPISPAL